MWEFALLLGYSGSARLSSCRFRCSASRLVVNSSYNNNDNVTQEGYARLTMCCILHACRPYRSISPLGLYVLLGVVVRETARTQYYLSRSVTARVLYFFRSRVALTYGTPFRLIVR